MDTCNQTRCFKTRTANLRLGLGGIQYDMIQTKRRFIESSNLKGCLILNPLVNLNLLLIHEYLLS